MHLIDTKKIFFLALLIFFTIVYSTLSNTSFFLQDSFQLLTATKNPFAYTLEYWEYIFSHTTNGSQYRPISYFLFFFLQRILFGTEIIAYQVISILLLILFLYWTYRWLDLFRKDFYLNSTLIFIIATHPYTFYFTAILTYPIKYFVPLIVFFYIHTKHSQAKHCPCRSQTIFHTTLFCLSIMCHEGSIIFPFLILILDFIKKKYISISNLILNIPSFIYLLLRVFIWKVPHHGEFMSVSLDFAPQFLNYSIAPIQSFFLTKRVVYLDHPIGRVLAFVSIILFIFFSLSRWRKNRFHLYSLLLFLTCLMPFSILTTHQYSNRSFWAGIMLTLPIQKFLTNFSHFTSMRSIAILLFTSAIIAIKSYFYALNYSEFIKYNRGETQARLRNEIKKKIFGLKRNELIKITTTKKSSWINETVFPAFIALNFPNNEFVIKSNSLFYSSEIYIYNGTYFKKKYQWHDSFGYPSTLQINSNQIEKEIHVDFSSYYFY